jgi:hypothetical protein
VHQKRGIAQDLCDSFVSTVTEIWSGEDPDTIVEAWKEGKKPQPKPGKKSLRQGQQKAKIDEAKAIQQSVLMKLGRGTPPDLINDMNDLLKDGLDDYFGAFKASKHFETYARARAMETHHVTEEDFHQFRVLGVGGFGSVNAAVKKDTGLMLAIKRMDKKLIKHKNRYRSCNTEIDALRAMSSRFICGLHFSYQVGVHSMHAEEEGLLALVPRPHPSPRSLIPRPDPPPSRPPLWLRPLLRPRRPRTTSAYALTCCMEALSHIFFTRRRKSPSDT